MSGGEGGDDYTRMVTSEGGSRAAMKYSLTTEGREASSAASLLPCLRPGLVIRRDHQTIRQTNGFGRRECRVPSILLVILSIVSLRHRLLLYTSRGRWKSRTNARQRQSKLKHILSIMNTLLHFLH